jgi:uncharacterized HhH-GPD family protein
VYSPGGGICGSVISLSLPIGGESAGNDTATVSEKQQTTKGPPAKMPLMRERPPDKLPYTGDDEADRLLAADPLALLIGFVLDQQVTLQKAFSGPAELRRRTGTLDAAAIASMDPARLEQVFRDRPALHRFPANMARRVQALCAAIVATYDGDAGRVWRGARDGRDLEARLLALPGIGPMKAKTIIAILGKRFGLRPPGWDDVAPTYPTLGDVDTPAALAAYQAGKRAHKAELRARERADAG